MMDSKNWYGHKYVLVLESAQSKSCIPVQFIKSFCCIEAEKRVKKKCVGTFNFNPRGKKGVL
jgi:hypothetical protein